MPLKAIQDKADASTGLVPLASGLLKLHKRRLVANPSRVVIRPFHLGWQASGHSSSRAGRLVADILSLSDEEVHTEYRAILSDFSERHWQTERVFDERAAEVSATLRLPATLSRERSRLIGAYFCHEYSYQAAALMNPSVVRHPDQSGLTRGAVRFAMSMRAVGEGHISSIAFREGIVEDDGSFELWPQPNVATAVSMLPDLTPETDGDVYVRRHAESTLSGSVIFPITEQQRGGLEDLRLVHFDNGDGTFEWVGTYTAYDGREVRSELITTSDFRDFRLRPIIGKAARNKGMALFPEKLGGSYYMIGRQDGKNLYLLSSDKIDHWDDDGVLLLEPRFPWEFIQIGNCGSPILTDHGWLVLTHGVGAMRKYSIGALLLDRYIPSKVLGRSRKPILSPKDGDREGYVPNVVYTCGAMKVGEMLFIPYGISDSAIGFATVGINDLIASLD